MFKDLKKDMNKCLNTHYENAVEWNRESVSRHENRNKITKEMHTKNEKLRMSNKNLNNR